MNTPPQPRQVWSSTRVLPGHFVFVATNFPGRGALWPACSLHSVLQCSLCVLIVLANSLLVSPLSQQYYANRPQPPSSTSRVQASTAPRPVAPTHVYQPSSQMMMIPQQLPFPTSQGPYYIPGRQIKRGEYRNTYVAPTQQYPVPTGTPSFYPGTSPAEYGTYAGAYYPAQGVQQYPPAVPSPTVMMNPAQQIPPKRERKQIRIRDPNQGGRDITEEIMSGGRTTSTPTPPQQGPALQHVLLAVPCHELCECCSLGYDPWSLAVAHPDCFLFSAAAVSIQKKKRKMKDLNKKETVGDLLDAFKESQVSEPEQAQPAAPISAEPEAARPPAPEETDETWEEKEDKLDTENIEPDQLKPGDLKYKYKEEQWKPINPEEKKQYDREFLLGFQFIVASMQKPEGLPHISDVVLDKANKNPLRALDPSRLTSMNAGPDFTPSYANLGRQPMGGRGPPRMDQYFNQMEKIIKEKKTSSRIRFMLQDVIDLRRNTWVPRRGDQGPKTIDQIHKEAELEEHREQIKVQQQLLSKKDNRRGGGGGAGRPSQTQDEGWNTVPISTKNRPIDTSRLSKITKPGALDFNNQLLAPGGRLMSWGKGSSGGSNAKPNEQTPESGRPATSTLNRFSALQQASSSSTSTSSTSTATDSDARRVVQRTSLSRERYERVDRFERQQDRADKNRPSVTKRSYSKETGDRSREREPRGPQDPVRRVASMTEDRERRGSREREHSKETVKREPAAAPAPTPSKPALTEDEFDKKSKAIIEEYLHINDMKEALQCVQEMNSVSLLFVFVRNGIESTLERSMIAREHMGLLLHQLVKAGTLSTEQYYKGLLEILEIAEDMEIDIPHIWLYLAELITPMLHEGGIPMEELFKEVSKPLVPLGKAGLLLVEILSILCKGMSHKKAGALWREAGLSWKDFLPEDEDVNKFVTEKKVEFTLGNDSEKTSKKELSSEELCRQLDKLLKEKADNQRIYDWVEANLDEQQVASNTVIRAVMTSICQSAIIFENPCRLDTKLIVSRSKVLQKYLIDEEKELQALYALQALLVKLEQPPNLLRMFFDALYDEDVIKEEAFYKWELSKDPAELQGKGVALKSVTAFFTWLREAEDESDS
ncbi:UNVERIFIED_CONTAM: hypothetical protein FKN15_036169 [Acipenser sinensis]